MNQFLSRQAVVNSFQELVDDYYDAPSSFTSIIERLPPYLCQQLALNEPYLFDEGIEYAYTGEDRTTLRWWNEQNRNRTIGLIESKGIDSLIDGLPLDGHRQVTNISKVNNQTESALKKMKVLEPERLEIVESWSSLIVWLEQDLEVDVTVLTSSTFPLLPHCTFVTEKAQRHIPPNSVSEEPNNYALRENLFHEALHQQLAGTLLHQDILNQEYSAASSRKVPIPWRGSAWEPDRALHATVVYTGLMKMRRDELKRDISSPRRQWLEEAISEAHNSLNHLITQLEDRRDIFTPAGEVLFDSVRSDALEGLKVAST